MYEKHFTCFSKRTSDNTKKKSAVVLKCWYPDEKVNNRTLTTTAPDLRVFKVITLINVFIKWVLLIQRCHQEPQESEQEGVVGNWPRTSMLIICFISTGKKLQHFKCSHMSDVQSGPDVSSRRRTEQRLITLTLRSFCSLLVFFHKWPLSGVYVCLAGWVSPLSVPKKAATNKPPPYTHTHTHVYLCRQEMTKS